MRCFTAMDVFPDEDASLGVATLADVRSVATGLRCPERTLAVQAGAEQLDINWIVDNYMKSGLVPQIQVPPLVGDFSETVTDYQTALNLIVAADRAFMAQPAKIRNRFNNDPAEFVAFCSDPENAEELYKMGLAERPPVVVEPPPMKVEVVEKVPKEALPDGKAKVK